MITRKTTAFIIDDLQPEQSASKEVPPSDDGDIATPKSDPSTDDDAPLT